MSSVDPTVHISLCLIARDSARTLPACLASIKPHVDEMIVVDTGSTDDTPAIAESHGAKVFHFPWCDDFSAARNESLRHATGRWVFWMDSDDTIDEANGRKLREMLSRPDDAFPPDALGFLMQVHCPGKNPGQITSVDHVKAFRNRPDIRFEGRIHEQVLPSILRAGGRVVWTDCHVTHSGSDQSPAGLKKKFDRDLRLLHIDEAERPNHPFTLFNLGMTYQAAGDFTRAAGYLERAIRHADPAESQVRKAFGLLVLCYVNLGRVQDARDACRRGLQLFERDPELLFQAGNLHMMEKEFAPAESAYRTLLEAPRQRYLSSVDTGILGFRTRHNLALVYRDTHQHDKAEAAWRRTVAEAPNFVPAWRGLWELHLARGQFDLAGRLLKQMSARPDLQLHALLMRADLALAAGDDTAAVDLLRRAADLAPHNEEPLKSLAKALFESDRFDEAEAVLRDLTARFPGDGAPLHNLGTLFMRKGDYPAAIDCYEQSLRHRPNWGPTLSLLAQARQLAAANPAPPPAPATPEPEPSEPAETVA